MASLNPAGVRPRPKYLLWQRYLPVDTLKTCMPHNLNRKNNVWSIYSKHVQSIKDGSKAALFSLTFLSLTYKKNNLEKRAFIFVVLLLLEILNPMKLFWGLNKVDEPKSKRGWSRVRRFCYFSLLLGRAHVVGVLSRPDLEIENARTRILRDKVLKEKIQLKRTKKKMKKKTMILMLCGLSSFLWKLT